MQLRARRRRVLCLPSMAFDKHFDGLLSRLRVCNHLASDLVKRWLLLESNYRFHHRPEFILSWAINTLFADAVQLFVYKDGASRRPVYQITRRFRIFYYLPPRIALLLLHGQVKYRHTALFQLNLLLRWLDD